MHEALTNEGGGCRAFLMVCHVTWEERPTFCVARHVTPATVPRSAVPLVGVPGTVGRWTRLDDLCRLHPTDELDLGFRHELGRVLADEIWNAHTLHMFDPEQTASCFKIFCKVSIILHMS